jgi:hypothetical protein
MENILLCILKMSKEVFIVDLVVDSVCMEPSAGR